MKPRNQPFFLKKGPITEQPGSKLYWFRVLNDFLSYGTFMYGAPKGTWWWEKYEIVRKMIFQCYCNFSQNFCIPRRRFAFACKTFVMEYCNIKWEEKLYFNAFASNCKVSLGNVIVLLTHTKRFGGKCKVSWGTQYFCESARKALRANAKFFRGTRYFFERTWKVLWVNAKFLNIIHLREKAKLLEVNTKALKYYPFMYYPFFHHHHIP